MKKQESENLGGLLRQFLDASAAKAAEEDIRAGERLLAAWRAPAPSDCTLTEIKGLMAVTARRRRRTVRLFRRSLATAAAVIVVALVGLFTRSPVDQSGMTFASILPAAIWESDNIEADDLDIMYFTAEIRRVEAQMHALEAEETEIRGKKTLDELEVELMAMETEFWKG